MRSRCAVAAVVGHCPGSYNGAAAFHHVGGFGEVHRQCLITVIACGDIGSCWDIIALHGGIGGHINQYRRRVVHHCEGLRSRCAVAAVISYRPGTGDAVLGGTGSRDGSICES